tara:strand:+ start:114 stop:323 length:210 start_codon:yes stop_codon:yes gene_type:complete
MKAKIIILLLVFPVLVFSSVNEFDWNQKSDNLKKEEAIIKKAATTPGSHYIYLTKITTYDYFKAKGEKL